MKKNFFFFSVSLNPQSVIEHSCSLAAPPLITIPSGMASNFLSFLTFNLRDSGEIHVTSDAFQSLASQTGDTDLFRMDT